jgi:hypothetical protein
MIAIVLCAVAFVTCFLMGRRSLGQGLLALLVCGYFYGILRANVITTFSHFIFDAGLVGLYLSQSWAEKGSDRARNGTLRIWTLLLIGWPFILVFLPFQPILISLVGLRGNVFFLPVLILGSRLKHKDLMTFAVGLAILNVVAFAFAGAEYFTSVQRFYPFSAVTQIIYMSGDVAGGYLRIPAIFTTAHAYGGTMVATIPFLMGAWGNALGRWTRLVALGGIAAAMLGVLMSATRQNFILGAGMVGFVLVTTKMPAGARVALVLVVAVVGWVASTNVRFQRFKELGDTENVAGRIAGSVNRGFIEILVEHPMGNGLGGGGMSMPYFLAGQVRNPIGLENEYALVLCEQGIVGLMIWVGFILWFLSRAPIAFSRGAWMNSRRMAWFLVAIGWGTAWIGTGLMTSIPQTVIFLLGMGWSATNMAAEAAAPLISKTKKSVRGRGLVYAG